MMFHVEERRDPEKNCLQTGDLGFEFPSTYQGWHIAPLERCSAHDVSCMDLPHETQYQEPRGEAMPPAL
jgi:hypothetical protein